MRILVAAVLLLVPAALAGTEIYNTMGMIQSPVKYDTGNGNAVSGTGVFGGVQDLRLADDFTVPASLTRITEVEAAYVTFFGTAPANGVRVVLYEDAGNKPKETPYIDFNATGANVVKTNFSDPLFYLVGTVLTVKNLTLDLPYAGHWWIDILPYDKSASGDWFYQVRDLQSFTGAEPYCKDGGEGTGGYGHTDWWSMTAQGYGAGDAAMRIVADVPEPASLLLIGLGALALRRR